MFLCYSAQVLLDMWLEEHKMRRYFFSISWWSYYDCLLSKRYPVPLGGMCKSQLADIYLFLYSLCAPCHSRSSGDVKCQNMPHSYIWKCKTLGNYHRFIPFKPNRVLRDFGLTKPPLVYPSSILIRVQASSSLALFWQTAIHFQLWIYSSVCRSWIVTRAKHFIHYNQRSGTCTSCGLYTSWKLFSPYTHL